MEIFIRDVPGQVTENGMRRQLQPYIDKLSIKTYHCRKQIQKRFATVTFLHVQEGQSFLKAYGGQFKAPNFSGEQQQLRILGTPVYCTISAKKVNQLLLKSLAKEEKDRLTLDEKPATKARTISGTTRSFSFSSVSCGVWGYEGSKLCFIPYFSHNHHGEGVAKFGTRSVVLTLESGERLDFLYASTKSITTENVPKPSITFTLWEAPRIYQSTSNDPIPQLVAKMGQMSFGAPKSNQRSRVSALGKAHVQTVISCFVYRIALTAEPEELRKPLLNLQRAPGIPPIIHQQVEVHPPETSFSVQLKRLDEILSDTRNIPWILAFQLRGLVMNGVLTPEQTRQLIPEVLAIMRRNGVTIAVAAVRKLGTQIPFPGLETQAYQFDTARFQMQLQFNADRAKKEELKALVDGSISKSENHAMIHRVTITPSGFYLGGPEYEPMNRVLRQYPKHHDSFIRVSFADEDGEPIRFNPKVSNEKIFQDRFGTFLSTGFHVAGRKFDFLGFSHSSLRAQSCWFMSPFAHNGSLMYDRVLIQQLGDFTKIRCPAKCAARIGQAFSETPIAVPLEPGLVQLLPDVERGSRVFSDGCGKISRSIMHRIWAVLPDMRKHQPTCFQIRYQGAKGMLSLDDTLEGDQVLMRPSMIKFDGSPSFDLELCNASYKSLPMYLNRQLIKIMEDIGVPDQWFLDLQSQEIERLRKATTSASNAAKFLSSHSIGDRVHLSWLIRKLAQMSIEFRTDRFLCDVLELSVMLEVKTLKHRARYPVPEGLTLYGIMDETGILEEGEIYCTYQSQKGKRMVVIQDRVLVTRSPALHPGDVQPVKAVNVPRDSPLSKLRNCICFSQKGDRDLPSMLSGGDLDGDLYNIIWDPGCQIRFKSFPADYPRQDPIDIGRQVSREDMTKFFVQFMETDQLGRIAMSHQILADQKDMGTFDEDCRILAEMHSTAVDFSKTGVPVDMKKMPKFTPIRPDFMSMGNHVRMEKKEGLLLEATTLSTQDDNNDDDDFPAYRYYESDRILGKLYRAIDEHEVFSEIKKYRMLSRKTPSVLDRVWVHVHKKCWNLQWAQHVLWAQEIREMYEDNLRNIMSSYSEHPSRPISELEAFIGNILSVTGTQSKKQRDLSVTMKEAFDRDAGFVVDCIIYDEEGEYAENALEKSMACLSVCLGQGSAFVRAGRDSEVLVSFGYLAAAVCLREMECYFT
ncbi:uncharacterized protein L3040_001776 [Drepanopeziza brunnea f. sp. 'multigermtubi']|uniref:RNA-dependent RNA polymerase n=1 Tax=Marssonina brunnea f. sp. multigermtubi (strain MB_m1) TaxID=1072389 RepID=K1X3W7_MARBU|nr:RNA-dependent RNA polymerase [Drepanopeziza brunnea f. sp. 'multigermtubi' MB_m1]EKD15408.1 RNA-dependent RNA polymerase [Drepanopeziza brunnea f. sp. 'multigermtubi' MB_m1]KAJ5052016.1 hypothetical protein L3040_001776 [Drepanopeziza brunnea f. sp. 'multigermtubi']